MLSTLFQHGEFTAHAVLMSRQSLTMFALGIIPFMLIKILAAGFYAKQDTRTPVRIGIIAMIANMVFNAILIWPFKHAGIALATSLSALLNGGLLYYYLRKRAIYLPEQGWRVFFSRLCFANLVMGLWLWVGAGDISIWISADWIWRSAHLSVLLLSAMVLYFAALWLAGLRPRHVLIAQQA
jgi:putative peptidoglycan lipid II flippase